MHKKHVNSEAKLKKKAAAEPEWNLSPPFLRRRNLPRHRRRLPRRRLHYCLSLHHAAAINNSLVKMA